MQPIQITPEAWEEFEQILERHRNGGDFYLEKDLRIFADIHGWHVILATDDKHEFQHRCRVLRRYVGQRYMWAYRAGQLDDRSGPPGTEGLWVYRAGPADHCVLHQRFNGVALHPNHPFWDAFYPPNGWMCGCDIGFGYSEASVRRAKGDINKALPADWNHIDPQTGLPLGIEPGFMGRTMPSLFEFLGKVINKQDYRWRPDVP